MEISLNKCLSEMIEDSAFGYQYHTNPFDYSIDELTFQSISSMNDQAFNNETPQNFPSASFGTSQVSIERAGKKPKTCQQAYPSSSSHIISFDHNCSSTPATSQQFYGLDSTIIPNYNEIAGNINYERGEIYYGNSTKRIAATSSRSPSHAIGERKRREKLSQRFIVLSAVVPGLKKMDKASVLGEAIKYLKHLQERVKTLEEQAAKKTMETAILVKKTQVFADDESCSTDENTYGRFDHLFPEIETRISDKDVLIRILCEKKKGCLIKILSEIEKFHLNVINTRTLTFGDFILDVTIVAQMDVNFSLTLKDFVKILRQALL